MAFSLPDCDPERDLEKKRFSGIADMRVISGEIYSNSTYLLNKIYEQKRGSETLDESNLVSGKRIYLTTLAEKAKDSIFLDLRRELRLWPTIFFSSVRLCACLKIAFFQNILQGRN